MSFWSELIRRNVFKVGAAYAIVAWLILQVAAITFPVLHLPGWALTLVTVLLIIGFPLILLFAWAFEITPDGLKRTEHVPLAESMTHITGQKLNYIVTGLLVVAMVFVLFKVNTNDRDAIDSDLAPDETESVPESSDVEAALKTIAVLPFADLSPKKDQEYFVDGLSEEILNSLAQIPGLLVTARTSSFTFKGSNKKIQEIADELGVAHILEGSVRKAGSALRISAQLIRASDGFHLWSETYDQELKDIFAVQENIATTVTNELKVKLGMGHSFEQLGGTDNPEAYEHYLYAQGLWNKTAVDEIEILTQLDRALESIDAAIAIDPGFALAWAYKSLLHCYISIFGPVNLVGSQQEMSARAARTAIELEPNLPEGHSCLGYMSGLKGEFITAGSLLRKASELRTKPVSWDRDNAIVIHYLSVGYFEKALEFLREMVRNDPLNLEVRGFYLMAFGLLGDMQRAEKEYERGRALFGDQWMWGDVFITVLRLDPERSVTIEDIQTLQLHAAIMNTVKAHLESPEEGLVALRRLYDRYPSEMTSRDFIVFSWWAAYFGDPEFAMDVIEKLIDINALEIFQFWPSLFREVRQLPRFKEFVREIYLVDYWNEFGWPDICRSLGDGDFECD